MKPETLNITHEIMNIIHMDPESKKYFGEHKPVQYIKFSSNGAITVHFIEGQKRDLIKGSELRTRSRFGGDRWRHPGTNLPRGVHREL